MNAAAGAVLAGAIVLAAGCTGGASAGGPEVRATAYCSGVPGEAGVTVEIGRFPVGEVAHVSIDGQPPPIAVPAPAGGIDFGGMDQIDGDGQSISEEPVPAGARTVRVRWRHRPLTLTTVTVPDCGRPA